MTPKEKAEYLLKKMLSKNPTRQDGISMIDTIQAKLCALVAVDEIIKVTAPQCDSHEKYYLGLNLEMTAIYWQEVKQELEKL
jgi:hypothetical protein